MHINNNHKLIGEKYRLFFFDNKNVPGQVMWLPKGKIMFNKLVDIIRKLMHKNNYNEVQSGSLGSIKLWDATQHTSKYKENIFYTNNDKYILKPMNCPLHILIAKKIYKLEGINKIKLFEIRSCYRKEKKRIIKWYVKT